MTTSGQDDGAGARPGGEGGAAPRLLLIVSIAGRFTVHPLPASGSVSIGRAEDNDIVIDDISVSRHHAVIHVGPPLQVEDLGSFNGIRLREMSHGPTTAGIRDVKAEPGKRIPVGIGDNIGLGSALLVVRRAEEPETAAGGGFVVRDEAMRKLHELAAKVAQGTISVLLLGETGVGKEVLAEVIHTSSPRRAAPFLRLNCAALSESLLESELFGHEKGAFTGAVQSTPGLFETADGGTVFLDEVGEMPAAVQIKLLRVLEERKVTKVGGRSARPIDVRVVAATNRDLEAEATRGTFRQDLFFRLNGISLTIPPLRERPSDIEPLALLFATRAARAMGRPAPGLAPDARAALARHPWPGNVRELRNVMERAVVLSELGEITTSHLLLSTSGAAAAAAPAGAHAGTPRPAAPQAGGGIRSEIAALERQRMLDALEACAGNQTQAAAMLGMSRRTFVVRLSEYQIPRPRKRS